MKEQLEYLEKERALLWEEIENIKNERALLSKEFVDIRENRDFLIDQIEQINSELVKSPGDYSKEARRDAGNVTRSLTKAKEKVEEIESLRSEINSQKDEIEECNKNFKECLTTSEENLNAIQELKASFESIYNEFRTQKEQFDNSIDFINKYLEEHPDLAQDLDSLEKKEEEFDDAHAKSISLRKAIYKVKKEIDEVKFELFGFELEDENGEVEVHDGTVKELENAYEALKRAESDMQENIKKSIEKSESEIQNFHINQNQNFKDSLVKWNKDADDIKEKIAKLLPDALTAGLSHAYSAKKEAEEAKEEKLRKQFRNGILMMIGVSLIPFGVSIHSLLNEIALADVIERLPRLTLAIFPLYIPVLWITYSANRKQSLSKRLIEEYAHKESLSKTFEGLSKQITNLEDDLVSRELRNKLLYNLLEVSSENPGKLISDYNKADHPVMDALDKSVKLANAVDKVNKIPGLRKMTDMLQNYASDILSKEDEKIEKGVEIFSNEEGKKEDAENKPQ